MAAAKTPDIIAENRAAAGAFASAPAGVGVEVGRASRRPFLLFRGPWWLVPAALGLLTVAACILLPLREENRKLAAAMADTQAEADYVARQAEANDGFIKQVHQDPALVERLAMRMTNRPAAGLKFLEGDGTKRFASSPYQMTEIAPPEPAGEYRSDLPLPLRVLFLNDKSRLIMLASGVFLMCSALVLGGEQRRAA